MRKLLPATMLLTAPAWAAGDVARFGVDDLARLADLTEPVFSPLPAAATFPIHFEANP